ncbi:MAG TPA: DUF502 domain-containing protein [Phycisphaerae bacterium]|nr:DUF502 domain-containing protein [Phycisphaerae bacterium]
MADTFGQDFRRFFFRGLAAVLPTALTIAIIVYVVTLIQKYIGHPINYATMQVVAYFWQKIASPENQQAQLALDATIADYNIWWDRYFWWVGFVLAIIAIYLVGRLLRSFFGRITSRLVHSVLLKLPIIKQLYPSVKQVTDFMLSEKKIDFSRVVAVEYPREGIFSIGLVTGSGMRSVSDRLAGELLTIFIPSSPTPITGYTIIVKRRDAIDLDIDMDDALRFTISGGVLVPPNQRFSVEEIKKMRQEQLPAQHK